MPPTRAQRLAEVPPQNREQFKTIYNGPKDKVTSEVPKSRAERLKEVGRSGEIIQEEDESYRYNSRNTPQKSVVKGLMSLGSGENSRISNIMAFLLIGIALFIDVIELLTTWAGGIGVILSYATFIFANLTFWFLFKIKGVGIYFDSPKKLVTALIASLVELIPAIDAIGAFGWTAWVILTILYTRTEDKTGIKLPTSLASPKNVVAGTIKETT